MIRLTIRHGLACILLSVACWPVAGDPDRVTGGGGQSGSERFSVAGGVVAIDQDKTGSPSFSITPFPISESVPPEESIFSDGFESSGSGALP